MGIDYVMSAWDRTGAKAEEHVQMIQVPTY